MTFEDVLDETVALLQRQGRLSYRALKRHFNLDDDYLEDLVVGEIGAGDRQEHLALGETPNVASRIEGRAASDTVAVSAATYQLVQGYFVCEDLGHHRLKGVDEPQPVYRVVGVSGRQSRLEVAATSLARLWQQQGKRQVPHDLLAPVYNWFTEGFDTADLQETKALLNELKS